MKVIRTKLIVFFEDPFWVGVFESGDGKGLVAHRFVFGPEPSDAEVFRFVQKYRPVYGEPVESGHRPEKRPGIKRLQREAAKELKCPFTGTKAMEALKKQRETDKKERKRSGAAEKRMREEREFEIRQAKKRGKRRGH